mgnify:CR=1 FL=1|jgi:ABC-2 type transport system ATP-binding protein
MTSTATPIRIDGLTKRFNGHSALENVSLTVNAGRVVGLLGRNGAGKTTLMRCLLGLARPDHGRAEVFGCPYPALPDGPRRVGVAMDGFGVVAGASGIRELRIWATAIGVPARRADQLLEYVGLADVAQRPVREFSTGMRRRLALAVALLPDPELLVLDEPANGLDPDGIRWLRETIRELAREGRSVLVSSHVLAEIAQTVDDVVVIQGSLRYAGPIDELVGTGQTLEQRFFDLVGHGGVHSGRN